jgi:myosin heavy subunit
VAYIDNQPVLDMIEKKPHGILPMIDEASTQFVKLFSAVFT